MVWVLLKCVTSDITPLHSAKSAMLLPCNAWRLLLVCFDNNVAVIELSTDGPVEIIHSFIHPWSTLSLPCHQLPTVDLKALLRSLSPWLIGNEVAQSADNGQWYFSLRWYVTAIWGVGMWVCCYYCTVYLTIVQVALVNFYLLIEKWQRHLFPVIYKASEQNYNNSKKQYMMRKIYFISI